MGLLSRLGKRLKILGQTDSAPERPFQRAPAPLDDEPASPRPPGVSAREFIEATLKAHPVVLFMKGTRDAPRCGFSANASSLLTATGKPYFTVDVLADDEIRQAVKEFSAWPTLPQVYIGGEFVGGADILNEMASSGELQRKVDPLP